MSIFENEIPSGQFGRLLAVQKKEDSLVLYGVDLPGKNVNFVANGSDFFHGSEVLQIMVCHHHPLERRIFIDSATRLEQ